MCGTYLVMRSLSNFAILLFCKKTLISTRRWTYWTTSKTGNAILPWHHAYSPRWKSKKIEIHLFYNWSCRIMYVCWKIFWKFLKKIWWVHINLSGSFVSLLPLPIACLLILCNFLNEPILTWTDCDIFCDISFAMLKKNRKIVMPKLLCKKFLQGLAMLWYEKMGKKERGIIAFM